MTSYIGFAATILSASGPVIQTVKTVRSKETKDLSIGMWSASSCSTLLWLVYGISIGSMPIVVGNMIVFPCALTLAILIQRNNRKAIKNKTIPVP